MQNYSLSKTQGIKGKINIAADKSISHRALILASLTEKTVNIYNLLEAEDVIYTKSILQALGVEINKIENYDQNRGERSYYQISGVGLKGLKSARDILYLGNSGTGARLLIGLLSGYDMNSFISGDDSLKARPMKRIIEPLSKMGARFICKNGNFLPIAIEGSSNLLAISHQGKIASAQVKSAILLAGLNALGKTEIIEPVKSRNHLEIMLKKNGSKYRV